MLLWGCLAVSMRVSDPHSFTVTLPYLDAAALAAARQLWAQLAGHVVAPVSRVVVTDWMGRDLLAPTSG